MQTGIPARAEAATSTLSKPTPLRMIARQFYAPVGGGVKTDEEAARMVAQLFPQERIFEVMSYIERKMALLPGMAGLDCCTRWAAKVQPLLPVETRAQHVPTTFSTRMDDAASARDAADGTGPAAAQPTAPCPSRLPSFDPESPLARPGAA